MFGFLCICIYVQATLVFVASTYMVVFGSQRVKGGLNLYSKCTFHLPIVCVYICIVFCKVHYCHLSCYCYELFVPGGWKYGHTQKDGCWCVILFHFIHKLDLWRMNCCCYHLLYFKILCLLDVSFFWRLLPF